MVDEPSVAVNVFAVLQLEPFFVNAPVIEEFNSHVMGVVLTAAGSPSSASGVTQ